MEEYVDRLYTDLELQNKFLVGITIPGSIAGFLIAVFVRSVAELQFLVEPDQYLDYNNFKIVITAGQYYRILSTVYFILSISAFVSVGLIISGRYSTFGRWLLFEIYTIGVIRSIFGLLFEDRYHFLGFIIMTCLIIFGLIIIHFIISQDRKTGMIILFIQLLGSLMFFYMIPITILDFVPTAID